MVILELIDCSTDKLTLGNASRERCFKTAVIREAIVDLRAVQTTDFITADRAELPYALSRHVSSRIINDVHGISGGLRREQ